MALRFLTAGESHGKGLVAILEGFPAGLELDFEQIRLEMQRRKQGYGRGARQRIEGDQIEFISGIRFGKTTASPLSFIIWNKDFKNWKKTMSIKVEDQNDDRRVHVPRPGHSDYYGKVKYGYTDMRDSLERSSARETATRVAIGSFAKQLLLKLNIYIGSHVLSVGSVKDETDYMGDVVDLNSISDKTQLRSLASESDMVAAVDKAKSDKDSLGGTFKVLVSGLPIGLGSFTQWDRRIEGRLAKSLMSLNAIRSVEVGMGRDSAFEYGSKVHDEFEFKDNKLKQKSNRCGGITAGITTGENIVLTAAMKPISTLMKPLDSVDLDNGYPSKAHVERADTCAVPAAAVIAESLVAIDLVDEILIKFGGDSVSEITERFVKWQAKFNEENS